MGGLMQIGDGVFFYEIIQKVGRHINELQDKRFTLKKMNFSNEMCERLIKVEQESVLV